MVGVRGTVVLDVGVTVEVTVEVSVIVGVGVSNGVAVTVGVGVSNIYTHCKSSQASLSIIFTIKLLSAYGEGTVKETGKVVAEVTNTQFALKASQ